MCLPDKALTNFGISTCNLRFAMSLLNKQDMENYGFEIPNGESALLPFAADFHDIVEESDPGFS